MGEKKGPVGPNLSFRFGGRYFTQTGWSYWVLLIYLFRVGEK